MKRKAGRYVLRAGEYKRSDGGYEYKYTDPATGKKKSKSARTIEELREKEEEINKAISNQLDMEKGDQTLNELWDNFIELKRGTIKPATLAQRKRMYDKHIRNTRLGNMAIQNIKNSYVKSFYKSLKKDLSPASIGFIQKMIYSAMEQAVTDRAIPSNPFKNAITDIAREATKKKKEALTDKEVEVLEEISRHEHYGTLTRFLVRTGLRIGEVASLTWADIDESCSIIHVRRAFREYRDEDGNMIRTIEATKTDAGTRDLPITSEIKSILEERKAEKTQATENLEGYSGFVFCQTNGAIVSDKSFNRFLAKMSTKSIRIPNGITAHMLRRTYATREVLNGTDLFLLMYRMGHTSLSITSKFYINIAKSIEQGEIKTDHDTAEKIARTARAVS